MESRRIARELLGPEPAGYFIATLGDFSMANLIGSLLKEPGEP